MDRGDNLPGMGVPFTAELVVEADCSGIRIDSFLVRHFRNYTSWRMQRLAAAGQVSVDYETVGPTRRVFAGDRVRVRLIEPPDKLLRPEQVSFRVVYDDPWIVVVDKPAGVIAHPTGESQTGTLANGLQRYLDDRSPMPGLLRPGIVHRLDRHTSGLMVVATHYQAHAELSCAFEAGRVAKRYLALVEGRVASGSGTIDLPIGRAQSGRGVLMSARGDAVRPRPAVTRYRVLQRFAEHTLVEATPRTGRNHQIRVHMAQIGHPLVGDEYYDVRGTFKASPPELPNGWAAGRHALHAAALEFAHPVTGVWMTFCSPLAADVRRWIQTLGPGVLSGCESA